MKFKFSRKSFEKWFHIKVYENLMSGSRVVVEVVNPLNAELNLIRHLLALVGAHHIVHVSGIRVNHERLLLQNSCKRVVIIVRRELCSCDLGLITRWRSWLRYCATNRKVAGSIPWWWHWNFSLTDSFRQQYCPGIESTCNRKGGKGGRYIRLTTLPPSCADCLEICEPVALDPTGPVQVCTGIALLLLTSKY